MTTTTPRADALECIAQAAAALDLLDRRPLAAWLMRTHAALSAPPATPPADAVPAKAAVTDDFRYCEILKYVRRRGVEYAADLLEAYDRLAALSATPPNAATPPADALTLPPALESKE